MHEEHLRQVEAQLDYLAPFLAQLPPGEKLTRWQAVRLKDECLSDFKQRLIDKANLIQARFEKVGPWPKAGEVTSLSLAGKWVPKSLLRALLMCDLEGWMSVSVTGASKYLTSSPHFVTGWMSGWMAGR